MRGVNAALAGLREAALYNNPVWTTSVKVREILDSLSLASCSSPYGKRRRCWWLR